MIHCPSCKAEIETNSWYCDQCGQEIKLCASCNKIAKGNICASCGDQMVSARLHSKKVNSTIRGKIEMSFISIAAENKNLRISRPVKMYLVNYPLGIRIEAIDEAIIGRRDGPYISVFGNQPYISNRHALLNHSSGNDWTITDLESSNGTFVDENRIAAHVPVVIKKGMKVQLANVELIVEFE